MNTNVFPPSTIEAFLLRSNRSTTAPFSVAVISDYDSQFLDSSYQSHTDTKIENIQRICDTAEIMARTALVRAYNYTQPNENNLVNCTLVSILVDCFTVNLACDYLGKYGFPSDFNDTTWTDDARRSNSYTSVFRPTRISTTPLITFAQLFFLQLTSEYSSPNLTKCQSNSDCLKGDKCVASVCSNGSSFFHPASSLGLAYDSSSGSFSVDTSVTTESTWTESNWQALSVKIHQQENIWTEFGFFVFGLALTSLTALSAHLIPKYYKRILYGMQ
eukprot:c16855_g1_i3.p1 GENE.c16855_g1_i3~~c16855_g1_i3.p1  ORF type:complete len:274 (-),score=109.39 c16855_g1_i3:181-1002(-)